MCLMNERLCSSWLGIIARLHHKVNRRNGKNCGKRRLTNSYRAYIISPIEGKGVLEVGLLDAFFLLPSTNKSEHACRCAFLVIFALFALKGDSPPASQKPKIPRKSITGRCKIVFRNKSGCQYAVATLYISLTERVRLCCSTVIMAQDKLIITNLKKRSGS